ncbi:MAG: hypothetical protein V9H26_25455 [Verrucomicrobiota bacterium]
MLVIGPGGGRDVLAALASGQAQVDGVELNPLMVRAVDEDFGALSSKLYSLPNVNIVIDEGRNYIARADKQWDIIQSSLVDTWAATSAGAFALSENNLYTVEAFQDYLSHLSEDGIFTMSRWFHGDRPTETLRMTGVALAALEQMGVENPPDHIAIVVKPESLVATLLVKRTPFTLEDSQQIVDVAQEQGWTVLAGAGHRGRGARARPDLQRRPRRLLSQLRGRHRAHDRRPPLFLLHAAPQQPGRLAARAGREQPQQPGRLRALQPGGDRDRAGGADDHPAALVEAPRRAGPRPRALALHRLFCRAGDGLHVGGDSADPALCALPGPSRLRAGGDPLFGAALQRRGQLSHRAADRSTVRRRRWPVGRCRC